MYPLKFYPIYKERIWGGTALAQRLGRELSSDKVGESWDVACHPNGTSVIANGPWIGRSLDQIAKHYGRQLLGTSLRDADIRKFPLLMKILDASDRLSVQVHPDDEYASENEAGELGKSELWYILHAAPGARIVYGLEPGVTREGLATGLESGCLDGVLRWVEVYSGDVFDIPAGLVHALGGGIIVAEIQQNSDTTYRVFDYNRLDDCGKIRELHAAKALNVVDFSHGDGAGAGREPVVGFIVQESESCTRRIMVANKHFAVELLDLKPFDSSVAGYSEVATGSRFLILTCTEGNSAIHHRAGTTELRLGESCLIPASLGRFELRSIGGAATIMKSFVPDFELDIVKPLREAGYYRRTVGRSIGGLA